MKRERNKTNEDMRQISIKQEENNEVKEHYSSDRMHRDEMVERILEEKDDLEMAVEDIIKNLHKDIRKLIDSLPFMETLLKIDKEPQTEKEP